jgi:hypothetical protein
MCQRIAKYGALMALLTLCLASVSWGQGTAADKNTKKPPPPKQDEPTFDAVYAVDVFQHLLAYDGTLKVVNDGFQCQFPDCELVPQDGNLCDDIYVIQHEQMVACCGCVVTPDESREFSVNSNLQANNFPPVKFDSVVVKDVYSFGPSGTPTNPPTSDADCDATVAGPPRGTSPFPATGLHSWSIKVQVVAGVTGVTEVKKEPADLSVNELTSLEQSCTDIRALGSGAGICTCGSHN